MTDTSLFFHIYIMLVITFVDYCILLSRIFDSKVLVQLISTLNQLLGFMFQTILYNYTHIIASVDQYAGPRCLALMFQTILNGLHVYFILSIEL